MFWNFKDLDTLRLALTSGQVPAAVAKEPATVGFLEDGRVSIEPSTALPRTAQNELKKLGVESSRTCPDKAVTSKFTCWLQVLPLLRSSDRLARPEQTAVLFDLPAGELPVLVSEALRLGNDRQGFRYLQNGADDDGDGRALLRIVGPPYYSLLRALDKHGGDKAPTAYVEVAPRLWVEFGHTHPLAANIKVPEGKLLLLQPPRQWSLLDDAPFRDVYEVLQFDLPAAKAAWHDVDLGRRIKVPMRLKHGGPSDAAEMWVVRDDPIKQLDELVSAADDDLLRQLSFAVAEKDGQQLIVLRVRPSKKGPPVLVLQAMGFTHSNLKLPNLFLPSGTRLHPPLRRDAVRKLLCDDPAVITWLYPNEEGIFTPESLPDTSFRPLTDWVDYVLDHETQPLQAWVQAAQFDFETFLCSEDPTPAKPKKPPADKDKERGKRDRSKEVEADDDVSQYTKAPKTQAPVVLDETPVELPKAEPNVLEQQLKELEERFVKLGEQGKFDSPEHQALWPEMAKLNAALKRSDDAGLCWLSSFWEAEPTSPGVASSWFRAEATGQRNDDAPRARGKQAVATWAAATAQAAAADREVTGDDIDRLLAQEEPTMGDVRTLAAYLFWAARRSPPPPELVRRLGKVGHFLQTHERLLPVRAVWLAWTSLVQISHGDVLGLARARDRLLERLFQSGLRPEQDMPSFLRFSGQPSSERFRAYRHWLHELCNSAHSWIKKNSKEGTVSAPNIRTTSAYCDLIFAFGLARLGEGDASRALDARAAGELHGKSDDVHTLLYDAYHHRIDEVLAGRSTTGPLPEEVLDLLKGLDKMRSFIVDRLRQHSRILEPDQKIDPYRIWAAKMGDLEKALSQIPDLQDRKEIADRFAKLLTEEPKGAKAAEIKARILRAALDLAPRVGEDFAMSMLGQVGPAYDGLPEAKDPMEVQNKAALLEKGMFVAAHFDRLEHIQALVNRFQRLLGSQRGPGVVQALDKLAGQCFRGLRKLGMRDEIDLLLKQMADLILESQGVKNTGALLDLAAKDGTHLTDAVWLAALRALLHVASGWFYFGKDKQAEPVLNAARTLLFRAVLKPQDQTQLACTYAQSLGQAPVELAQKRIEEMFQKLDGVRDSFTTNSHYGLLQLDVIEAIVLAVVTDDFTLGSNVRRWLDDDEFLVRRRIHRDLRTLMDKHEK